VTPTLPSPAGLFFTKYDPGECNAKLADVAFDLHHHLALPSPAGHFFDTSPRSYCGPKPEQQMAKRKRGRSTAAIDDHVGARIRERRIILGLTQQQLARLIGVTYQQMHKYERGVNRISAGRLLEIGRVLSVPVGYFFEGIGEDGVQEVPQRERMMLDIARNFADITDERHRDAMSKLARALAEPH
jgi:transcriptional regulator with XRE-family HTH domain